MATMHDLAILTALTLINTLMIFSLVAYSAERRMIMPPRIVRITLGTLGTLASIAAFVLSVLLLMGKVG